jgi:gluconolactonase
VERGAAGVLLLNITKPSAMATTHPSPCTESYDPRFDQLVRFNAELELLAEGFRWLEGPVWFGDHQCLLFNDIPNNRTLRWHKQNGVSVFREPSGFANGQTRDRQGRLITCHHSQRELTRIEYNGDVTTLVDTVNGKKLNTPNDVVVKSDGSIWFSDPVYGLLNDYEGGRQLSEQHPALYRLDPSTGEVTAVARDFEGPNGLAFSPDETKLYVAESGGAGETNPNQFIREFEVSADGKSLLCGIGKLAALEWLANERTRPGTQLKPGRLPSSEPSANICIPTQIPTTGIPLPCTMASKAGRIPESLSRCIAWSK